MLNGTQTAPEFWKRFWWVGVEIISHDFCKTLNKEMLSIKFSTQNLTGIIESLRKCTGYGFKINHYFFLTSVLLTNPIKIPLFLSHVRTNNVIYEGNSISKLQILIEKNRMEIMTYKQHLFFNIISIQI